MYCILLPSSTSTTSLLDRNAYIGNLAISLLPLKEIRGDEERVGDGDAFEFDNMLNLFGQNETFLKICLLEEPVQAELMAIIIERMIMLAQSSSGSDGICVDSAHPAMKLLNHLRWCDVIYDPKQLVDRLMEPVTILPTPFQIEIISSLPGLVADTDDQNQLVSALQDITESHPELVPCVLETVSNLCLPPDSKGLSDMVGGSSSILPLHITSRIYSYLIFHHMILHHITSYDIVPSHLISSRFYCFFVGCYYR